MKSLPTLILLFCTFACSFAQEVEFTSIAAPVAQKVELIQAQLKSKSYGDALRGIEELIPLKAYEEAEDNLETIQNGNKAEWIPYSWVISAKINLDRSEDPDEIDQEACRKIAACDLLDARIGYLETQGARFQGALDQWPNIKAVSSVGKAERLKGDCMCETSTLDNLLECTQEVVLIEDYQARQ